MKHKTLILGVVVLVLGGLGYHVVSRGFVKRAGTLTFKRRPLVLETPNLSLPWLAEYYQSFGPLYHPDPLNPRGTPYATEHLGEMKRDYSRSAAPRSTSGDYLVRFLGEVEVGQDGVYEVKYRFNGKAMMKIGSTTFALNSLLLNQGSVNVSLRTGKHAVKIAYYSVQPPGYAEMKAPAFLGCMEWTVKYYNNIGLLGRPVHTACARTIDYEWMGRKTPPRTMLNSFSARWTRYLTLPAGETRQFELTSKSGALLKLDRTTIIDNWMGASTTPLYATYHTGTEKRVKLELQYWNRSLNPRLRLNIRPCPPPWLHAVGVFVDRSRCPAAHTQFQTHGGGSDRRPEQLRKIDKQRPQDRICLAFLRRKRCPLHAASFQQVQSEWNGQGGGLGGRRLGISFNEWPRPFRRLEPHGIRLDNPLAPDHQLRHDRL